ncbi:MAG: 2-dehydropantoate 2-reductase [Desulfobacterales bacterium]|nr:2-dehydropantoate 2-reductase [Desulfobacterales bacterium]
MLPGFAAIMTIMRIAVIGAGAMGSLFGSRLAAVAPVVLVNHRKAHSDAINAEGLVVEGLDGLRRVHRLAAVSDPHTLSGPFDLAIIFTKSGQTRAAAATAARLLAPAGVALSLQNGLGNREVLAEVLGAGRALVGVTAQGATLVGPGRVRHAGDGPTWIARLGPDDRVAAAVCSLFNAAGIQTELADDPDRLVWGKLIVNVGINALAALLRVPNGVLAAEPACERLMAQAVAEAVAVAHARGIDLPYPDPLAHVRAVCRRTAENRASMLQDVLRGAPTEVAVINGAIVRLAGELGLAAPCNTFLTTLIAALEATAASRCS